MVLIALLAGCRETPPPNAIDHIAAYNAVITRSQIMPIALIFMASILVIGALVVRGIIRRNDMRLRKELLREERLAARRKGQ